MRPALGQEVSAPPVGYVTLRRSSRQNGANNTCLPGRLRAFNEKMDMRVLGKFRVLCPHEGLRSSRLDKSKEMTGCLLMVLSV